MLVTRHQSIGHVRELLGKHGVHSLPVVNAENEPIGIVTSMDLVGQTNDEAPVGQLMTRDVYTIPKYADVHLAARMMRNHRIHHLVVTHEGGIVGLVSSFDLLRLIENKRFVIKNLPSRPQKGGGKRRREEEGRGPAGESPPR
jgi:signal-transduction protein with cAMP-binding, CBS, and nucleotidyltransferase domain